MSRQNSSILMKITAAVLSVLIIAGTLSVSTAFQGTAAGASADEAPIAKLKALNAGDEAKSYTSPDGKLYYSADNLKKLSFTFKPEADGVTLTSEDSDKLSAYLNKADEAESEITEKSTLSISEDGNVSFELELNKVYSSGIGEGEYVLLVKYNGEDAESVKIFEKKFTVIAKGPEIGEFEYKNNSDSEWIKGSETISFTVTSEIIDTVEVVKSDSPETKLKATKEGGKYSFDVTEGGKYQITAKDKLGNSTQKETANIKIDKTAPTMIGEASIKKGEEDCKAQWTSSDLTVSVKLQDNESGLDTSSVTVQDSKGGSVPASVEPASEGAHTDYTVSFTAVSHTSYTIQYADKVKNSNSVTINESDILIDKEAPKARDITITFSKDESSADASMRLLSFGLYDKREVRAKVEVNDGGLSPIKDIVLYDGSSALDKISNDSFKLPTKDGTTSEESKYNLSVEVTDEAENTSKFNILNSDDLIVTIKDKDSVSETLDNGRKKSFEIILNEKSLPEFGEISASTVGKDHIAVRTDVKVEVSENVSGLNKTYVKFGKKGETLPKISESEHDYTSNSEEKTTSANLSFAIPDVQTTGEYTVTFVAENNCGKENTVSRTFYVDKTAPEIEEFEYSNNQNENWTKNDVTVKFKPTDDTGIKEVKVSKDGTDVNVNDSSDGNYSFTAESYGEYTVKITDVFGNTYSIDTQKIKIDKENPQIENIDYNKSNEEWTNKPATINFTVKDYSDDGKSSGVEKVTVSKDGEEVQVKDLSNGNYSFTADKYGKYEITVYDVAGNSNSTGTEEILYETDVPEITGIEFEGGNKKKYGIYSKNSITMTVSAKDAGENQSGLSEESVKAINSIKDSDDDISLISKNPEKGEYVFTIGLADAVKNLSFTVTDNAGNSKNFKLGSEAKIVEIDSSGMSDEVYEVLVANVPPEIDTYKIQGFDGCSNNTYKGNGGTLSAVVRDEFAGITDIEVKFGKIKLEDDLPSIEKDYETKTSEFEDITDKAFEKYDHNENKIEEVNISYDTSYYEPELQTGRYAMVVEATNNVGNTTVKAFELNVDNTKPKVTGVSISGNKISKYNEEGVYSGDSVEVKISVDDSNEGKIPSAGIAKVVMKANGGSFSKEINSENHLASGDFTFELPCSNDAYKNITFTVEDCLGYSETFKLTDFKVSINGNESKIEQPNEDFEIVASEDNSSINIIPQSGETVFNDIDYKFSNGITTWDNNLYCCGDGTITAEFEDTLSGLNKGAFKIEISKDGDSYPTITDNSTVLKFDEEKTASKITSFKVTFDTEKFAKEYQNSISGIADGNYSIKYTVVNNSGVERVFVHNFNIDKTAPAVTEIDFRSVVESPAENLFRILTFGFFAKTDVKVTLTIEDSAPSCGIDDDKVKLTSENGAGIKAGTLQKVEKNGNTYKKEFTLSLGSDASDSNYNDIYISISDRLNNKTEGKYHSLGVNPFEGTEANVDENFDIILNNDNTSIKMDTDYDNSDVNDPQKDGFLFKGFAHYSDNPSTYNTYSDVGKTDAEVSVKLSDKLSGLSNVTAEIAKINKDNGEFTSINEVNCSDNLKESKVLETVATVNLSDFGVDTGVYRLKFTAENNIGLTKDFEVKFRIDETAPKLEKIKFTPVNSATDTLFNALTFGLFSNQTVKASVTFSDKEPSAGVDAEDVKLISEKGLSITEDSGFSEAVNEDGYKRYTKNFYIQVGNSEETSNYKDMIVDITDKFDNHFSSEYYNMTESDGAAVYDENYDIIVNNDKNTIKLDTQHDSAVTDDVNKDGFAFNGFQSAKVEDRLVYSNKYSEKSSISAKFIDNLSGIADVTASLSKDGAEKEPIKLTLDKEIKDEKGAKINEIVASYDTTNALDSGNYILTFVVENNIGLKNEFSVKFSIDETAPAVDKIKFIPVKKEGLADNFFNVITFGLFSQSSIQVELTVSDSSPSALINDEDIMISSEKGNSVKVAESASRNGDTYVKVFELATGKDENDSNYNDINISVEDIFDNSYSGHYSDSKDKVFVNDEKVNPDKNYNIIANGDNSSIVMNKSFDKNIKEDLIKDGFAYENFSYSNQNGTYSDKTSENATITAEFTDKVAGIQSVTAEIVRSGNSNEAEPVRVTVLSSDNKEVDLASKRTATVRAVFNATEYNIKSGMFKLTYIVTNNSNLVQRFTTDFNIDETYPELYSVKFESAETSAVDRFLNFLTFGLYSNQNIKATVTVRDALPSSGISEKSGDKGLLEALRNNRNIDSKELKEVDINTLSNLSDADKNYKYYSKVFTLSAKNGNNGAHAYYNNFDINVTDNAANNKSYKYYDAQKILIGDKYTYEKGDGNYEALFNDKFDIVAALNGKDNDNRPKITKFSVEAGSDADKYQRKKGDTTEDWYSGSVVLHMDVTDAFIKSSTNVTLQSFDVKLNGKKVTKYCKVKSDGKDYTDIIDEGVIDEENNVYGNSKMLTKDSENTKLNSITVTLDTSDLPSDLAPVFSKNTFTASVRGNNDSDYPFNEEEKVESVFYLDNKNPTITHFDFAGQGNSDASGSSKKSEDRAVEETDYGYFFREATDVTVTAEDEGCGVDEIWFYTEDINGKMDGYYSAEKCSSNGNKAVFTVEKNFKGRIFAYAIDYVKNQGDEYSPKDAVVESHKRHTDTTKALIIPEKYKYNGKGKPIYTGKERDADKYPLYKGDTDVELIAESTYSGIRKVEYKVTAPAGNVKDNQSGSVGVPIDSRNAESVKDWKVDQTKRNLVTRMSKKITVRNNSNYIKIWIKVTDRAGYATWDQEIISIDKTAPTIKVSFSSAHSGNRVEGREYYNKNRTALITVTERNFDSKKFVNNIKNTYNGYCPRLIPKDNWTNAKVNTANQDGTKHTAQIVFDKDGDYTLHCEATDLVGNKSKAYNCKKFTVDKVVPVIKISFDKNRSNTYYNSARTATITITEHNFLQSYSKVNISSIAADNASRGRAVNVPAFRKASGDKWVTTVKFDNDGQYAFTVDFRDRADNKAKQQKEKTFYIDTQPGEISFIGVTKEKAYGKEIAPIIQFDDNNIGTNNTYTITRTFVDEESKKIKTEPVNDLLFSQSSSSTRVKYTASNFPVTINKDGVYKISAKLVDLAGNEKEGSITFSVNRFGSTFTYGNKKTKKIVGKTGITNNAPDIVIEEYNVNPLTKQEIKLTRDDETITLKSGTDYTIQTYGNKNDCHRYVYTIKAKNFDKEGNYVVTITSVDAAKNFVSNRTAYKSGEGSEEKTDRTCPISFVVDKTKPVITITGIESNQYYEEASKSVNIICDDANIVAKKLRVMFDGKEVKLDKKSMNVESGSVEGKLNLEADGNTNDREFKVIVSDRAGNVSAETVTHFRLSASWLARTLHYHMPLVIFLTIFVLAAIGVCIFLITKKRRQGNSQ